MTNKNLEQITLPQIRLGVFLERQTLIFDDK